MATITVTPIKTFISGETVTPAKLNELSQSTVALTAGSIVAADIAADAVTAAKLADSAVTNAKIASGVDASKLTTGTLPADRIGSSAITTARINDAAVTAANAPEGSTERCTDEREADLARLVNARKEADEEECRAEQLAERIGLG